MEKLKLIFCMIVFVFIGVSCGTSDYAKYKKQKEAKVSQLRVGMDPDDVKSIHDNLGNCSGSAKSVLVCEWVFSSRHSTGHYLSDAVENGTQYQNYPLPGDQPKEIKALPRQRQYRGENSRSQRLIFENNKLARWSDN